MTKYRSQDTSRFALEQNQDKPRQHLTMRVRQPGSLPGGGQVARETLPAPAHPPDRLVVQLNERWRVIDDPLQWILQRKKGNSRTKNTGWSCRFFCLSRDGLLQSVREYCGEIDPDARAKLRALPDFHRDREKRA
jgi:hypothetical protein